MTQSYEDLPQDLPEPHDDGAAAHLPRMQLPSITLPSTAGGRVNLSHLPGLTIVYAYPRSGRPGEPLPEGWDGIPGARGCTPQACAFRDHFEELRQAGVGHVFGLSTQDTDYQRELAERLHLPFPMLSDAELALARLLRLPTFKVHDMTLLKRLTLVLHDGVIEHVFYPVFPPDRSAETVVAWLRNRAAV